MSRHECPKCNGFLLSQHSETRCLLCGWRPPEPESPAMPTLDSLRCARCPRDRERGSELCRQCQRGGGAASARVKRRHGGQNIPPEKLLEDLRRVMRKEGRCTYTVYCMAGEYSPAPFLRHFGTWGNALEAAGCPVTKAQQAQRQKRKGVMA